MRRNILCLALLVAGLWPFDRVESFAGEPVIVNIQAHERRSIRAGELRKSALDRNIYFRSYHMPGLFSEERDMELKELGALPGRGTGPSYASDMRHSYDAGKNAERDMGLAELKRRVEANNARYVQIYRAAAERFPGVRHALACNPSSYPDEMRILDKKKHPYAIVPEAYGPFSELIAHFYDVLKKGGCSVPYWMSSQNEPSWKWGGEEFARYTRTLALTMAQRHPEIKVCGPCPAWPYPGADFKRWYSFEKPFVDIAGDVVGAYDLHFYSKGYWAYEGGSLGSTAASRKQEHPSLYVSQKKGNAFVWDLGRVEAYLDLLAAYHMSRWGTTGPKPLIVSEFGRQGIHPQLGPWENEFKQWIYMTTVTRFWMTFMVRPEIELTVPFILGEPGLTYGAQRGQAIYTRTGLPEDPTPRVTRFRDFYLFFREFQGDRVGLNYEKADYATRHYLRGECLLDGNVLYLLLHNGRSYPENPLRVQLELPLDTVQIVEAGIKRMRWEGPVPEQHADPVPAGKLHIDTEFQSLDELAQLDLAGEETCLVRVRLSAEPAPRQHVEQTIYYAMQTLQTLKSGRSTQVAVRLPDGPKFVSAELALGLAADGGFTSGPRLRVNGVSVMHSDLSYSRDITQFHNVVRTPIPPEVLKPGDNLIEVEFTGRLSDPAYLVSAALVCAEKSKD